MHGCRKLYAELKNDGEKENVQEAPNLSYAKYFSIAFTTVVNLYNYFPY